MVNNQMPVVQFITMDNNNKIKHLAICFIANEEFETYEFVVCAWFVCGFAIPSVVITD